MRALEFWDTKPNRLDWRAKILQPLSALYAMATARRIARAPQVRCQVPVICIGNLNVGGTGKTPMTIALIERLMARDLRPHVVLRGYGGRLAGPLTVRPHEHTSDEVGDEALLLAAFAQVHIARDRGLGANMAERAGADLILLDDGFQNPSLYKDLSLIVVDAQKGFGNGLCLPAGPLREPVKAGLARADFMVLIGEAEDQALFRSVWAGELSHQRLDRHSVQSVPVPLLLGALRRLDTGMDWQGAKVMAFAGIGYPEKFFATLRAAGAEIVHKEALQDHQPLTPALMRRLASSAKRLGAQMVTTEKDAVRLPGQYCNQVLTLPVRLHLQDWSSLDVAVDRLLVAS